MSITAPANPTAKFAVTSRKTSRYVVDDAWLEDVSPFGLQGLRRQTISLLKADRVGALAANLALRGTRKQIRDETFVANTLASSNNWCDNYQVVHLIEKSLWINGRSDLVMTLVPNPSQIPDDPPPRIREALTRAYALHPQATVWYGVPLFSDQCNAQGLPIPLTAQQVEAENRRRIQAAQTQALRWRWLYRAARQLVATPGYCARIAGNCRRRVRLIARKGWEHVQQARMDAKRRQKARIISELEYARYGRSSTAIPAHSTLLGRVASNGMKSAELAWELFAIPTSVAGAAGMTAALIQIAPTLFVTPTTFVPLAVVSCDPFLFVELPGEDRKLRHLGHWYWQGNVHGKKILHLHV